MVITFTEDCILVLSYLFSLVMNSSFDSFIIIGPTEYRWTCSGNLFCYKLLHFSYVAVTLLKFRNRETKEMKKYGFSPTPHPFIGILRSLSLCHSFLLTAKVFYQWWNLKVFFFYEGGVSFVMSSFKNRWLACCDQKNWK